jgi:arginine/serine-rich splicing factor 7
MSRIFVKNIPSRTKESDLRGLFSKYGNIVDLVLKTNFAFIQYENEKEANSALKNLNDYNLMGNKINVESAKSRVEKMAERINEKCFKCGEFGHWAKDCKLVRREKREKTRKYTKTRKSPKRSFSRSFSDSDSKSRSRSRSK